MTDRRRRRRRPRVVPKAAADFVWQLKTWLVIFEKKIVKNDHSGAQ